jgi:hypothetical protein
VLAAAELTPGAIPAMANAAKGANAIFANLVSTSLLSVCGWPKVLSELSQGVAPPGPAIRPGVSDRKTAATSQKARDV